MKFMRLLIIIENKNVELQLLAGQNILDRISFPEERDLAEKLLPMIQRLLKKNQLTLQAIRGAKLKTDLGKSFTAYRIAQAAVNAFNWAGAVDK